MTSVESSASPHVCTPHTDPHPAYAPTPPPVVERNEKYTLTQTKIEPNACGRRCARARRQAPEYCQISTEASMALVSAVRGLTCRALEYFGI